MFCTEFAKNSLAALGLRLRVALGLCSFARFFDLHPVLFFSVVEVLPNRHMLEMFCKLWPDSFPHLICVEGDFWQAAIAPATRLLVLGRIAEDRNKHWYSQSWLVNQPKLSLQPKSLSISSRECQASSTTKSWECFLVTWICTATMNASLVAAVWVKEGSHPCVISYRNY